MKIDKDLLNLLKIETVYICANDTIYLSYPMEINDLTWFITTDSSDLSGNARLKVKYRGSFLYLNCIIHRKQNVSLYAFCYEIEIDRDEKNKDNFKFSFFQELKKIEEKSDGWNKRKEVRYEIGLDEKRQKLINFKEEEQLIVCDKQQLPCLVNNLSYSGAKITTLESGFQKDKKVCLYLSFKNPIEQIPLMADIKNCIIKATAEKKVIAILSLKFENSPVSYKERLEKFIKQIEG